MPIQIQKYNQEELYFKFEKDLFKQADDFYIQKHFKIGNTRNIDKLKLLILLKDVMASDNCIVSEFIEKKLRGALENDNIEVVDLETVQSKYRNITNNYYNSSEFVWDSNIW